MDAVSDSREIEGGKGVNEAGGKTAETAVAERHVRLELAEVGKALSAGLESLIIYVKEMKVDQVVLGQSSHQELGGKIMNRTGIVAEMSLLGLGQTLEYKLIDGSAGCFPPGKIAGLLFAGAESGVEMMKNVLLNSLLGKIQTLERI